MPVRLRLLCSLLACLLGGLLCVPTASQAHTALGSNLPGKGTVSRDFAPYAAPFHEAVTQHLREYDIPGASLTISYRGRLMLTAGYGLASLSPQREMLPTHLVRVGSITKAFTGAGIMLLLQQGKFGSQGLNTPVLDVLGMQAADPRARRITLAHLLTHQGGWDREISSDPMGQQLDIATKLRIPGPAGADDIVRYMLARPLDFEPGTRRAYSSFGFCLLGRVIERVSGLSYEEFIQQQVLAPLGVTGPRIGGSRREECREDETEYHYGGNARYISVFAQDKGKPLANPAYGGYYLRGLDGWIATSEQLVQFADRLSQPGALYSQATLNQWLSGGYGWVTSRPAQQGLRPAFEHGGSIEGSCGMLSHKSNGFTFAVLLNKEGPSGSSLADPLVKRLHELLDTLAS